MRWTIGTARRSAARALGLILAATVVAIVPASASGQTFAAECSTIQSTITSVAGEPNHGEGDVIVLKGMCSASGVTIPNGSNFTLQGAPSTTSGFDGTTIAGPLLTGNEVGALTVEGLTFQHDHSTGSGNNAVSLRGMRLALRGDSFLEDSHENPISGALFLAASKPCPPVGGPPAITLLDSTFLDNALTVGGGDGAGGAAFITDDCNGTQSLIEDNRFEGNTLHANGSERVVGAGLLFSGETTEPVPLTQAGNAFESNRIVDEAGVGSYGGGGEWLEGASLTSVGDRFTANTIPGTSGAYWSWGAGLGILACDSTLPTQSELENAVVAGNSILGGTPAAAGGGGIYVGCGNALTTPNHLALLDSTVTENTVPAGGIAGIDGKPADQLALENSIVASDIGGSELGGFEGAGGSLTAAFSDACRSGAALPGEGNICADPKLADDGNPSSFDIHETAASPTRDTGSNALVPAGLTTDFYGSPRIAGGTTTASCMGATTSSPVVDIGAAEFSEPIVHPSVLTCPLSLRDSVFAFPKVSRGRNGLLRLTFASLAAGKVTAAMTFTHTRTVVLRIRGKKHVTHHRETLAYASAAHISAGAGAVTLALKPGRRALALLRHSRHLSMTLKVTFSEHGPFRPTTQSRVIHVRYIPPLHQRR